MKTRIRSRNLAPLLITLFALAAVSAAHASDARNCSTASVAGKFGFTTTGTIPALGPVAATGVFTQDQVGEHHRYSDSEFEWRHCGRDLYGDRHSESRLHGNGHDSGVRKWSSGPHDHSARGL